MAPADRRQSVDLVADDMDREYLSRGCDVVCGVSLERARRGRRRWTRNVAVAKRDPLGSFEQKNECIITDGRNDAGFSPGLYGTKQMDVAGLLMFDDTMDRTCSGGFFFWRIREMLGRGKQRGSKVMIVLGNRRSE